MPTNDPTATTRIRLTNTHGIHVRTASLLAELCESYKSEIIIESPHASSEGTDMMRLLMLQASYGTELSIAAIGHDASEAIAAIEQLIEIDFPAIED